VAVLVAAYGFASGTALLSTLGPDEYQAGGPGLKDPACGGNGGADGAGGAGGADGTGGAEGIGNAGALAAAGPGLYIEPSGRGYTYAAAP
jgi:hypothetical protein